MAGEAPRKRSSASNKNMPLLHVGGDDPARRQGGARMSMSEVVETVEKNKLGTLLGVYLPCILGIFGAILFLRLPWAVGQAGILGTLLIFLLAGVTVILTVMSIAAISTNGTMKGGGAYYMISRAIGPEFGGAVGLVFFAANSVGITFYLIAFAEELGTVTGDSSSWAIIMYASIALIVLLGVSLIGASAFAYLNFVVAIALLISIIVSTISFFVTSGRELPLGFHGPKGSTFSDNLWFGFSEGLGFFEVFIVVFPAMTGVMAGANMSGDLRDPGKSIGSGTMMAVWTALIVYSFLVLVIGASVEREQLRTNLNIMQDVCFSKIFVVIGLFSSTISSALASLVGSARVLQALARDNLFPFLRIFAWGSKKGDEPRIAVLLAWLIAQSCLFVGNLNMVASLISGFFLLVYCFTNAACFVLRISGAPNFRPRFKYFTWHTALAGSILCLLILFISGPVYASVSIVILLLVWFYVHYTAPITDWGDVTQALIYHQVRKYLLRLDERKMHPKFWRPSLLLLVQHPASDENINLVEFGNNVKKGGMYVLGNVLIVPDQSISTVSSTLRDLRHLWLDFIEHGRIKAFNETSLGTNARVGYQNLVLSAGVGGMKPNTVMLSMYTPQEDEVDLEAGTNGSNSTGTGAGAGAGAGIRHSLSTVSTVSTASSTERRGALLHAKGVNQEKAMRAADSIARLTSKHSIQGEDITLREVDEDQEEEEDAAPAAPTEEVLNTSEVFRNSKEFCGVCQDVLELGRNLIVAHHFANVNKDAIRQFAQRHKRTRNISGAAKNTIDIWITFDKQFGPTSTVPLQLQLAHILHRTSDWNNYTTMRMVAVVEDARQVADKQRELEEAILNYRVDLDIWVLPIYGARNLPIATERAHAEAAGESRRPLLEDVAVINELMRHNSANTCLAFLTLPPLPPQATSNNAVAKEYLADIDQLTQGLPPCLLVSSGKSSAFVTSEL